MPRPSSPLISHDAVVEASLRIIDADGLDAFSLPLFADSIRSFLRGAVPGVPEDAPVPRDLIARYRETREAAGG
jgi:hypothetical protein